MEEAQHRRKVLQSRGAFSDERESLAYRGERWCAIEGSNL
jgi:hypothetical protein